MPEMINTSVSFSSPIEFSEALRSQGTLDGYQFVYIYQSGSFFQTAESVLGNGGSI